MTIAYGLGIDLGTTQTAAAVRVDGRVEVVRLGARRPEIPSLVFVKPEGGLLIGDAAERRGQSEPARLAREFKRRMGDPVPILVGGSPFSAHALTAKLLRHVLDTVQTLQDGPPVTVTVTHPANWGPYKREQLDQAVRLADAGPVRLRTEPEAAALQHATARRIASGETVAVYDLGGGTFDAAVLRRDGDGFSVLGEPEGVEQLGGADFDEAVFGHVLGVLGSRAENLDPDDPEVVTALARLRRDSVEAKEALSFDTEVMIPVALPGLHTRVRLNRSELESMIAPSLEDTVDAMRRALRSAGVEPGDLSAVLLAGGSSRIPLVAQLLSTAFERPVVADPHPEHSIALGAAVATAEVMGGVSPFAAAIAPEPVRPAGAGAAGRGAAPPAAAAAGPGAVVAGAAAAGAGAAAAGSAGPPVVAGPTAAAGAPVRADGGAAASSRRAPAGNAGAGTAAVPAAGGTTAGGTTAQGEAASGAAPGPGAGGATVVDGSGPRGFASPPATGGTTPTPLLWEGPAAAAGAPAVGAAPSAGTFSRGTASVPGTAAPPPGSVGPMPGAAGAVPPAMPGTIVKPGVLSGRTRKIVMVAAVAVTLLAAGTATAVAMSRGSDKKQAGGGSATVPPSAAASQLAAPAVPYPTDTVLARSDQGDAQPPESFHIVSFTPGQAERTTVPGTEGHALPQWSADRTRFVTTRPEGTSASIWVHDADGGNREKVVSNAVGRAAWSPDDKKIAFMRKVGGVPQIFVITVGRSDAKQLTWSSRTKDDPAWSPDGETIAYWRDVDNVPQLYLLRVDDPKEPGRRITSGDAGPAVDPAFSPDGKTIAYTRHAGSENSDIWLVDADGGNARPLTDNAEREMDPNYAPDGSWISFVRGDYAKVKVAVIKADGSDEAVLTADDAREGHPAWS